MFSLAAVFVVSWLAWNYGGTDPRRWDPTWVRFIISLDVMGAGNWPIFHPSHYHGHAETEGFFEGWYFKLTTQDEGTSLAFIPGIHFGTDDRSEDTAFIIVVDANHERQFFFTFPASDFQASRDYFDVRIGRNHFTATQVTVDLDGVFDGERATFKGTLSLTGLHPWPVAFFSPGAMGPFAWLSRVLPSGMQCLHSVLSMRHTVIGEVAAQNGPDSRTIDFTDGIGYTEKDWGHSFPTSYFWAQCSHFSSAESPRLPVSLFASLAVVPISETLGFTIKGFIIGLQLNDTLVRFATYSGASLDEFVVSKDSVRLVVSDSSHRLQIDAERDDKAILLPGPRNGRMEVFVPESLGTAGMQVTFEAKDDSGAFRERYAGVGRHAGVEVVGDTALLEVRPPASSRQEL